MTKSLVQFVLNYYDSLDVKDADNFFSSFGPGNLIDAKDRPHERFEDYEDLLKSLQDRDKQKYEKIHKGTPFFFLSWLAFDLRNYEKALYYLDASISEDVKNAGNGWINLPSAKFLELTTDEGHVAKRTIKEIRDILKCKLCSFNKISLLSPISIGDFVNKFVKQLMMDSSYRTIITSFYVFLLEYKERLMELRLKSDKGSSMDPIISHLFSGGLIFESLLKKFYPNKDDGCSVKSLGDFLKNSKFRKEFVNRFKTTAKSLEDILNEIKDNSLETAFSTTAKIRNTAGHNLVWDNNIFNKIGNYERFIDQIVNALLFVIEKKFIR